MRYPEFLAPYLDGDSPKRIFQGLAVGIVATVVVGFSWGGWQLGSTADERVGTAREAATVAALAPICADKFARAAQSDNGLVVELEEVDSWMRNRHLIKTGWATFPGGAEPDGQVAQACASLLSKTLNLN